MVFRMTDLCPVDEAEDLAGGVQVGVARIVVRRHAKELGVVV